MLIGVQKEIGLECVRFFLKGYGGECMYCIFDICEFLLGFLVWGWVCI